MKKKTLLLIIISIICFSSIISLNISSKQNFDMEQLDTLSFFTSNLNYDLLNESWTEFPFQTKKEFDNDMLLSKQILNELNELDLTEYDEEKKRELTKIKDYLNRKVICENEYYFVSDYLTQYFGFEDQMYNYLMNFTLDDKEDIERLLQMIKSSDKQFEQYIKIEKERQKKHVGMNLYEAETIAINCDKLKTAIRTELSDIYKRQIDLIENLTEDEKLSYKNKLNAALIYQMIPSIDKVKQFVTSYEKDWNELSADVKKDVLNKKIKSDYGIDDIVTGIQKVLDRNLTTTAKKINNYLEKQSDLKEICYGNSLMYINTYYLFEDFKGIKHNVYHHFDRVKPIWKSWRFNNIQPAVLSYYRKCEGIQHPEKSMLLTDYYNTFKNYGYYNYPGLKYLKEIYQNKNFSKYEKKLDYYSFVNGWSEYVSGYTYNLKHPENIYYLYLNDNDYYQKVLLTLIDIKINFENINFEEAYSFYNSKALMKISKKDFNKIYDNCAHYSGYYIDKYLTAIYMEDLQSFSKIMRNSKDVTLVHSLILDCGPSSYKYLEQKLREKIQESL